MGSRGGRTSRLLPPSKKPPSDDGAACSTPGLPVSVSIACGLMSTSIEDGRHTRPGSELAHHGFCCSVRCCRFGRVSLTRPAELLSPSRLCRYSTARPLWVPWAALRCAFPFGSSSRPCRHQKKIGGPSSVCWTARLNAKSERLSPVSLDDAPSHTPHPHNMHTTGKQATHSAQPPAASPVVSRA